MSAGSPLRLDVKENILTNMSENLFELYGFSEGFATMLKPHDQRKKFGSVGTPVLGFEIKIIDEKGNECSPNVAGEIAGYGAGMMKEYYSEVELTNSLIWSDNRGRSFIKSGDIGSLDEDGFLTVLDRKKDMIISGGLNVFPVDIEEVVSKYPDITDVTVIGGPHEKWGETCVALIIPKDGIEIDWRNTLIILFSDETFMQDKSWDEVKSAFSCEIDILRAAITLSACITPFVLLLPEIIPISLDCSPAFFNISKFDLMTDFPFMPEIVFCGAIIIL